MSTVSFPFLLDAVEGVVEDGEDVEEEDEELDLGPVSGAESAEGEVLVVDY